jgi:hypothetical protein
MSARDINTLINEIKNNPNAEFTDEEKLILGNYTQIIKLGGDIDGEAAHYESGYSVSLSANGTVVAIGAIKTYDNYNNSGHVRIYDWKQFTSDMCGNYNFTSLTQNTTNTKPIIITTSNDEPSINNYYWTQRGSDIDGEAAGDYSGTSVSLSSDGNVVAIGATTNSESYRKSGHVRIYEWKNGTWTQRGNDIDGEADNDYLGWSVSLSDNGNVVAIGAPTNYNGYGHVRIYAWTGSIWNQRGSDIDGQVYGDETGHSVSLSSNGNVVAIGMPNPSSNNSGLVRIYEWTDSIWTQRGNDIIGVESWEGSGYSVSLSADGTVVAIGVPYTDNYTGHVRIYEWKNGTWRQIGNDINGESQDDSSGWSVSLSSDGNIVAIGAPYNDGNSSSITDERGHVRIYELKDGTWTQRGPDIDGEAYRDYSGYSVSLSKNGNIVAIGSIYNDGNSYNSGHVRIYEIQSPYSYLLESQEVISDNNAITSNIESYNQTYDIYLKKKCQRPTIAHLSRIPRNPAFHQNSAVSSSSRTHRLKYNAYVRNSAGTSMDPKILYGQSPYSCDVRKCKK